MNYSNKLAKYEKLNSFLQQFKELAVDYFQKNKGNVKIERFFTDIADLLTTLIDEISTYVNIMFKSIFFLGRIYNFLFTTLID
jgi:hypothetical protein